MDDQDRLEGAASTIGDASREVQGAANRTAGKAQDICGQAVDEVKQFASTKPFAALLSAMGIGMAVGFFLHRR
jgi:ElaB/YqjD/DUF883 family membrane-anchored ribosome-binding protein